jgi:hypothetical protein
VTLPADPEIAKAAPRDGRALLFVSVRSQAVVLISGSSTEKDKFPAHHAYVSDAFRQKRELSGRMGCCSFIASRTYRDAPK